MEVFDSGRNTVNGILYGADDHPGNLCPYFKKELSRYPFSPPLPSLFPFLARSEITLRRKESRYSNSLNTESR